MKLVITLIVQHIDSRKFVEKNKNCNISLEKTKNSEKL